jgi:hypothetical protein
MLLPGLPGMHLSDVRTIRGMHLSDPEIGWTNAELGYLIRASESFTGFCDAYFMKPLSRHEKEHWAEKTPANVLQFFQFMRTFDESYIIHMVRNPYDTVASLVARGMPLFQAAAVYLYYTAHGLAARQMPGYLELSYEQLVSEPSKTVDQHILQPLGLQFSGEMLGEGNPAMSGVTKMQGWRSDELAMLSGRSVSRFADEPEALQRSVVTALASIRITESCLKKNGLAHRSVEMICTDLKYDFHGQKDRIDTRLIPGLMRERKQVIRKMWMSGYGALWRKYPVEVNDD